MSVTPPDPVLDSKFPLDHLDDLPLPGRPADSPRIDDDEITLPGHWTSFLAATADVLENGPKRQAQTSGSRCHRRAIGSPLPTANALQAEPISPTGPPHSRSDCGLAIGIGLGLSRASKGMGAVPVLLPPAGLWGGPVRPP